jgi:hypothetical protein
MATQRRVRDLKFLICPGWVTSKNDGDRHYITAHQLMRLYMVRPEQCLIQGEAAELHIIGRRFDTLKLIPLRPSYHGHYPVFQESSGKK